MGLTAGALTGALLAAVWQGVLLAVVVWVGLRLLPKTPAAVRFAVWFSVFLAVAALPVISLWPRTADSAVAGHGAWLTLDARWSLMIAAVWIAASTIRAVSLVVAGFQVRALWRRAVPVEVSRAGVVHPTYDSEAVVDGAPELVKASRRRWGRRPAQLCVSDEVDRPAVIGFFAPKILIPGWLFEKLTAGELEQVMLHEAGHLGRADDWMNLLQKVALVVFPLNPVLAWVERRLCFERELAVDERVLRAFAGRAGAAKAYASCLATLAEYRMGRRGTALAIGALGRESELGRRVGRILRRGELMRPVQARLVLGGAMLVLLGASAGLERCPQVIGFAPSAGTTMAGLDAVQSGSMLPRGYRYQAVVFHPKTYRQDGLAGKQRGAHESLLMARSAGPAVVESQAVHGSASQAVNQKMKMGVAGTPHAMLLAAHLGLATDTAGETEVAAKGFQNSAKNGALNGASNGVLTSASGARMRTISVARPAKNAVAGDGVVRWVVVTSWQAADGSRLVMATEGAQISGQTNSGETSESVAREADQRETAQPPQQMRPYYAALPVRDGWLVFQL